MSRKLLMLTINAFLLIQCTHSLTVYSGNPLVEKPDFVTPCKELLESASKELDRVWMLNIFAMQEIFKKVLSRATELKHQSPLLQQHLAKLSEYVQKVEKYKHQKITVIRDIVGANLALQQERIVESYNHAVEKSPESFPTEVLLTIYGLRELLAVTKKNFEEITKDLDVEFGRYVRTLPRENSENRQKILDWYEKYTNESDLDTRMSLIIVSTSLFDKQ